MRPRLACLLACADGCGGGSELGRGEGERRGSGRGRRGCDLLGRKRGGRGMRRAGMGEGAIICENMCMYIHMMYIRTHVYTFIDVVRSNPTTRRKRESGVSRLAVLGLSCFCRCV